MEKTSEKLFKNVSSIRCECNICKWKSSNNKKKMFGVLKIGLYTRKGRLFDHKN